MGALASAAAVTSKHVALPLQQRDSSSKQQLAVVPAKQALHGSSRCSYGGRSLPQLLLVAVGGMQLAAAELHPSAAGAKAGQPGMDSCLAHLRLSGAAAVQR